MQNWMKSIFRAKDRNKKREKKEERLKSDKMKRLLQFSISFPTKLEDDASVLAFMCHLIRMMPLLPSEDDQDFLDEPALVSNIKSNIIRLEDARATAKYETLGEIIQYLQSMYLANPGFLRLVFKPIFSMKNPYNNKDEFTTLIKFRIYWHL